MLEYREREPFYVLGVERPMPEHPDGDFFRSLWEDAYMPHHATAQALSVDGRFYNLSFGEDGYWPSRTVAGMAVPLGTADQGELRAFAVDSPGFLVTRCPTSEGGAGWDRLVRAAGPTSDYEPTGLGFEILDEAGESAELWLGVRPRQT